MLKVDRNKYKKIKKIINIWVAEGRIVSHKQQKRSGFRKQCYQVLAETEGISYDTVQKIGRSKSFTDFRRIQWPQGKRHIKVKRIGAASLTRVPLRKPEIGDILKLENAVRSLTDEVTQLQTEMAIIKSKKTRWFNG